MKRLRPLIVMAAIMMLTGCITVQQHKHIVVVASQPPSAHAAEERCLVALLARQHSAALPILPQLDVSAACANWGESIGQGAP